MASSDALVSSKTADESWKPITRIVPHTQLRIIAKEGGGYCVLQSVSDDGLVCLHGSKTVAVRREDIKTIRLAHRGRSIGAGLAFGAAAGAGLGAGIGSAINSSDKGSLLHVSEGKSAGVGAALGIVIGATTGALVGYATSLFGVATMYQR